MNKNGIIFDLDGTLWDSCAAIVPSWQKVIDAHKINRPPLTLEEMQGYMGKTIAQIAALMLPMLSIEDAVALIMEGCEEEHKELSKNGGILYEDIIETMRTLSQSYSLYIVSNCQNGYIQTFVEHYGLEELISDFEMAGRTGKTKGENIRLVIERNGLAKAIYVGDTAMDKEAADAAGVPFVYASYGFGDVKDAEYILTKPSDLINTVTQIFV